MSLVDDIKKKQVEAGETAVQENLRKLGLTDEPVIRNTMTLEQYFRTNGIDHEIRCTLQTPDSIEFHIHPAGKDGDTLDFIVRHDTLEPK